MSSRELEERMENELADKVAATLGIARDELDLLQWEIEPLESDDGHPYGSIIRFSEGSDPEILAKINGLQNNSWIQVGII